MGGSGSDTILQRWKQEARDRKKQMVAIRANDPISRVKAMKLNHLANMEDREKKRCRNGRFSPNDIREWAVGWDRVGGAGAGDPTRV